MPLQKEFRINEFITLKLEKGKTNIYIKNKLFRQCKYLLINIPSDKIESYNGLDSIDEAANYYSKEMELRFPYKFEINPETEFWGHCSNIQAWAENEYNPRILHSTLSLPLLQRLTEEGDQKARQIFKEEIVKRLEINDDNITNFLIKKGYLQYFDKTELEYISEKNNHPGIKSYIELIDFDEKVEENIKNYVNQQGILDFIDLTKAFFEKMKQYLIYFRKFVGESIPKNKSKEIKSLIFLTLIYEILMEDEKMFESYIFAMLFKKGYKSPYLHNITSLFKHKNYLRDLKIREYPQITNFILACIRNEDLSRAKRIYSDFLEYSSSRFKNLKILEDIFQMDFETLEIFKNLYDLHHKLHKKLLLSNLIKIYNENPNKRKFLFLKNELDRLNWSYKVQNLHIFVKIPSNLDFQPQEKDFGGEKVLFLGLDDTGKTALQKLLYHQNIFNVWDLMPSKGLNVQELQINQKIYYIWDIPGNKRSRERYLEKNITFPKTSEIIYFIDILKETRYPEALKYLSRFLNYYEKYCFKQSINPNHTSITILFHKMDPTLISTAHIIGNAEFLAKKISELNLPFKYKIQFTSIYNFNNKNYAKLLKNKQLNKLSLIINELLSTF
ncbi:MAG: hypothetical protein EU541_01630 [Promethearchaeota archaeon]|nr:MAG: hypothetical protein EU541_01630 [Candidatus Lokiarchaeota archaeon]